MQVVETEPTSGVFAVVFGYDDGTEDFAVVSLLDSAEWYATVQKGETFPIGLHPLLLKKARPRS